MPKRRTPGADFVQVTVRFPVETWRAMKVRAIEEDRLLRDAILDAIRLYLATPRKGRTG